MTDTPDATEAADGPKRVVLRYEDQWSNLRSQLDADRAIGLTESVVRTAVVDWLDDESFVELGTLVRRGATSYLAGDGKSDADAAAQTIVPADGVITGWGEHDGRLVFIVADDVAHGGEVRGDAATAKAERVKAHALEQSAPLIQVFSARRSGSGSDGGGSDGGGPLVGAEFVRFGYGVNIEYEQLTDDRILKVAIVYGALDAQASFEATWCHLIVLCGPNASLFGCGGDVALAHGMADLIVDDLRQAFDVVSSALRHLPASRFDEPPQVVPSAPASAPGSRVILDDGWVWDLTPAWCTAVHSRLGTVGGAAVGLLAAEQLVVLDAPIATKLVRTAAFCRTFGCPLIIDHAGFDLPATPTAADVRAIRRLALELAAPDAVVIEVSQGPRQLRTDLGIRPLCGIEWPATEQGADARTALVEAAAMLRRPPPRHADDERVKQRVPRTLTGS